MWTHTEGRFSRDLDTVISSAGKDFRIVLCLYRLYLGLEPVVEMYDIIFVF